MTKRIEFVSPVGVAVFPHITLPDTKGKFANGKYKTRLELEPADFAKVKSQLLAIAKTEKFETSTPKMPFGKNQDGEECQVKASSKFLPMVIDAKKRKIVDIENPPSEERLRTLVVRGGSRIRIGCSVFNYGEGLSLQLETVQVIEAKAGRSLDGFDEEDGYEYEEPDYDAGSESEDAFGFQSDEPDEEIDL